MCLATQEEITLLCTRICEATCVKTQTFDCEVKLCEYARKSPKLVKNPRMRLTNGSICFCVRLNTRLDLLFMMIVDA